MPPHASVTLLPALYRAGVRLCPPAFRHAYGDQMLRDFADATAEAAGTRFGDRCRLQVQIWIDLVRTIVVQWARSGVPMLVTAAVLVPATIVELIVSAARQLRFPTLVESDAADLLGLMLIVTTVIVVLAATVACTVWAGPRRRLRR